MYTPRERFYLFLTPLVALRNKRSTSSSRSVQSSTFTPLPRHLAKGRAVGFAGGQQRDKRRASQEFWRGRPRKGLGHAFRAS